MARRHANSENCITRYHKETTMRQSLILPLLCAIIPVLAASPASLAQTTYPAKTVRIVVPFTAGGATDVIARLVAARMQESWGQSVVIENRAGATGAIGSEYVARAQADGYTMLMGTTSTHALGPAIRKMPYTASDFSPMTLVSTFPNMLVIHPSLPASNIPEFIALLKANPGKYHFASSGNGSSIHLNAELFKQMTGTQMGHVPYKGSSQALTDLLAGVVHVAFDNMATVWPQARSGKLRALGVTTLQRMPVAPDVPAVAEHLKGFEAIIWVGFFGPAGMPQDISQKVAMETRRIVQAPDVIAKLADLGAAAVGSSPAEFAAYVKNDSEKWGRVWRSTGLTEKDLE
jgi:tripartite-type tricarboxylate transporter receptor subunit TctC